VTGNRLREEKPSSFCIISSKFQPLLYNKPQGQKKSQACRKNACHTGTSLALTACVQRFFLFAFLSLAALLTTTINARSEGLAKSRTRFYYSDFDGSIGSARIIRHYWIPEAHPAAPDDDRLDPRLRKAASIAQERANARSKARCWQYVKTALVESGVIDSYPRSPYATQAGDELERNYGFKKLPIHDQYAAPVGSVLVFGHGIVGHVSIRTKTGFVSDYWTNNRCKYPLVAVYAKFSS